MGSFWLTSAVKLSIRLPPFAFVGFKPLPRSFPHDPIHEYARSAGLLLNLAA